MSKIIYVVSERSFEYNDEIYHFPENGDESGVAQFAFSTKKEALLIRDQNNVKWLKELTTNSNSYRDNLGGYTQDGLNGLQGSQNLSNVFDKYSINYEHYEYNFPSNLSDEAYFEIVKEIGIAPWIVSEVVYEDK